jgi:LmbE family N-acetylglucosaminyl deacetylase
VSCLDQLRAGLDLDVGGGLTLLVVVAHPDDETLGAGALIQGLAGSGPVFVLHTTDGAPRDMRDASAAGCATRGAYAEARRREAEAALALAGVQPGRVACLGYVDQELSLALASAARRLASQVRAVAPDVVLTHAYEGGHPDHDGTAFAVHAALALIAAEAGAGRQRSPVLLEMGLYHERDGRIRRVELPPAPGGPVVTCALDAEAAERKRAMCDRYLTQREVLRGFPLDVERFRRAPRHDFTAPPLPGPLHYERFPWGFTGARWRRLAAEALGALGLAAAHTGPPAETPAPGGRADRGKRETPG